MEWYKKSIDEVLKEFKTSKEGLNSSQIEGLLNKYGENKLPSDPPLSLLKIFVRQFMSPLIYILIIAAIIAVFAGKMLDSVFIIIVVLVNAFLGFYQEWQAEKSSQALKKLIKIEALVLRDGEKKMISAQEIVPGDIVILNSGDRVAADLRLIEVDNLSIDGSLLTGESSAVNKNSESLFEDLIVPERSNMAYAGTVVNNGFAKGVVVCTGLNTEIGKIAKSVVKAKETKTPLLVRLDKFSTKISVILLIVCLFIFFIGVFQGRTILELFFLSVALLVSAIPEGLPIAVTAALSRGAFRMAKRKVVIRRLSAVEALGSCSCIASDKTGTLTINKQIITKIVLPEEEIVLDSEKIEKHNFLNEISEDFIELIKIGFLCNEAELKKKGNDWIRQGDEVDVAFKMLAYDLGINIQEIEKSYKKMATLHFDPELRYMASGLSFGEKKIVGIKGAVEAILPLCNLMKSKGEEVEIDKKKIESLEKNLTDSGYRVIAVAEKIFETDLPELSKDSISKINFTLLGLVGMHDPIRPGVKDAIARVKKAGVDVIMITGDHPGTAFNIAKQLDIAEIYSQVKLGKDLDKNLKKEDLSNIKVFARVMPMQKLSIVRLRKQLGDFVAVTGDGANDAPALKEAHLGLAMGSGTEIAKDASLAIITDDSFVSIVAGIEEGRTAYANIRKVIYLLISAGTAEVFLIFNAFLFNLPIPLTAVQILWLNLVTNGIQDVALAFEPAESFFLKGRFYTPQEGIFNFMMIKQVLVAGLFMGITNLFLWMFLLKNNFEIFDARNYLFLFFIVLQNFHVFNCKSEYKSIFKIDFFANKFLLIGVFAAHILHLIAMYIPGLSIVLKIKPVSLWIWFITILSSLSIIVVIEIFKFIQNIFNKKNGIYVN